MNLSEFEREYAALGKNPKTAPIDKLNKSLIKRKADVSFLRDEVEKGRYFRTYFQVSIGNLQTIEEKLNFIEKNFDLLSDWWHTDCLPVFLGNEFDFDLAYEKAKEYIKSDMPYVRRFGYIMFIPRLTRSRENCKKLLPLLKNDDVYHVIMGEAWLISYIAMTDADMALEYIKNCSLSYDIVGKTIQKICDSFVVSADDKERFKALREERRHIK